MVDFFKWKKNTVYFTCIAAAWLIILNDTEKKIIPEHLLPVLHPAKTEEQLIYPGLVNRFYQLREGRLFWLLPGDEAGQLRQQLLSVIDTSLKYGLISGAYHKKELTAVPDIVPVDSVLLMQMDRLYTDAAIAAMKDINQGNKLQPWVGFDQLSEKYAEDGNDYLLASLARVHSAADLVLMADLLEPQNKDYALLKQELRMQMVKNDKEKIRRLTSSMNYYRWIHHFRFGKYIVVNIAAAELRYYKNDSMFLQMKIVAGKTSTPTPRFSAFCDQVILYPYWHVPRSIAVDEFLPLIKKNPFWLDGMNMQVIDGNGKVVDHHQLSWSVFSAGYFPYGLRQSTGCDNALGVIKFNITSPYGVYLHDTNYKNAFLSAYRYYSHGCIRIEKPIELGNYLLGNKLDTAYLRSCIKDQKPVPLMLEEPVPVFVVYMTVEADSAQKIRYYKDVYKLFK